MSTFLQHLKWDKAPLQASQYTDRAHTRALEEYRDVPMEQLVGERSRVSSSLRRTQCSKHPETRRPKSKMDQL